LSWVLVAFTIEFDNEFEHRVPNWTTSKGRQGAPAGTPWLVSHVMWANVMAHVPADGVGIGIDELHDLARTDKDSLTGLQRWGYVKVGAAADGGRLEVVRSTAAGRRAQEGWRPLAAEIEARWRTRFGPDAVEAVRGSLQALADRFEVAWPDYVPIVFPTQNGKVNLPPRPGGGGSGAADLDLSALLSRVLLQFTYEFEGASRLSLPIAANTLRVLDRTGVPIRDLPRLTGVSKEANSMAVGFLARRGCLVVDADPTASGGKRARLTPKGQKALDAFGQRLSATEAQWVEGFGRDAVGAIRQSLTRLVGEDLTLRGSPLAEGLTPYPDGWRSSVRPPETLPHYPMVLHRGGYPDGS
jgi:DNA-binding MarR family transcriptional regulator